jgi:hypothetical protein
VGEQGTLRVAGGARRVHQDHRIVGCDGLDLVLGRCVRQGRLVVRVVARSSHFCTDDEPSVRWRDGQGTGSVGQLAEAPLMDQSLRPAVVEQEAHLARRKPRVDRQGEGADPRRRKDRLEGGRPVAEQDPHPIPARDTRRQQPARETRDA